MYQDHYLQPFVVLGNMNVIYGNHWLIQDGDNLPLPLCLMMASNYLAILLHYVVLDRTTSGTTTLARGGWQQVTVIRFQLLLHFLVPLPSFS